MTDEPTLADRLRQARTPLTDEAATRIAELEAGVRSYLEAYDRRAEPKGSLRHFDAVETLREAVDE